MNRDYERILEHIGFIYQNFLQAEKIHFADLRPSMLEEDIAVVYAIFDKNSDEAIYVGRTTKLRRRIYTNHLQGNESTARLKKYLVDDNNRHPDIATYLHAKEWMKKNCYLKYIEVKDPTERGHIEGLLGYLLSSTYIEKEH